MQIMNALTMTIGVALGDQRLRVIFELPENIWLMSVSTIFVVLNTKRAHS